MRLVIALVLAYLIGSIPVGLWLGRALRGIDVRDYGSGNIGATNVFRTLGTKLGIVTLALDVFKGALPVILLPAILGIRPSTTLDLLIGAAAIAGHVFSCFVSFRGGKGVATALGVFLAISTSPTIITVFLAVVIIARWGYISAASVAGAAILPTIMYLFGEPTMVLLVTCALAIVVIVRHRANIMRILSNTEPHIWDRFNTAADNDPIPPVGPAAGRS